jgi:hypothetical protein
MPQAASAAAVTSADRPCRRPRGNDPADADYRGQQVANRVGIERQKLFQSDGDEIEQPAVQIKIAEMKQCLVGKARGVVGDDHLAVALLYLLVVRDRIVLEGEKHECHQRGEEQRRDQVEFVRAREPAQQRDALPAVRPDEPLDARILDERCCACGARRHHRHCTMPPSVIVRISSRISRSVRRPGGRCNAKTGWHA